MMSALIVEGGRPLNGRVRVHGAKNSALPILAASLLVPGRSVIRNCPPLSDVTASLEILRHLGCQARQEGDTVTVEIYRGGEYQDLTVTFDEKPKQEITQETQTGTRPSTGGSQSGFPFFGFGFGG